MGFSSPINNAVSTVGAAYAPGAGQVTLATGFGAVLASKLGALGIGAISAAAPLRFTLVQAAAINAYGQILDPSKATIFEATGLAVDTLTGVSVKEGTSDQAYATGDTFAVFLTAGMVQALQAAIVALQSGAGSVTNVGLAMPGGFTVTGSPVTSTGVLTAVLNATGVLKGSAGALTTAAPGTDYVAPGGVAGGQSITGGTGAGDSLNLGSTTNGTKGLIKLGADGSLVALGQSSATAQLDLATSSAGTPGLYIHGSPSQTAPLVDVFDSGGNPIWTVTAPAGGSSTTPFGALQGTGGTSNQNGLEVTFNPNPNSNATHYAIQGKIGSGYHNNSSLAGVFGQAQSAVSGGGALVMGVHGFALSGVSTVGTLGLGQNNGSGGTMCGAVGNASSINATVGTNNMCGGAFAAGGAFPTNGRMIGVYGEARNDSTGNSYGAYFRLKNSLNPFLVAIPTYSDTTGANAVIVSDCYQLTSAVGVRARAAATKTATVSNKALTSNVATLTTSAAHGIVAGETIVVAGVDATFNGTFVVASVPTATTLTFALVAANVASQAATGTIAASQTGNLFQAEGPTGTLLSAIRPDGSIALPPLADSAAANGSLYFSSTTSKLTYKDGTGALHAI